MPRGDKSKDTSKKKRKAEHIEEGYERSGVSEGEAERRAWATVNRQEGGGRKRGSGGRSSTRSSSSTSRKSSSKRSSASTDRTNPSRKGGSKRPEPIPLEPPEMTIESQTA